MWGFGKKCLTAFSSFFSVGNKGGVYHGGVMTDGELVPHSADVIHQNYAFMTKHHYNIHVTPWKLEVSEDPLLR